MSIFPNPTSDGCRIFCTKTNPTTDDDCFEPEQFCKASLAVLDLMLKAEPVYGNIVIYDLKNIRLSQFLAFTPTITKNFVKCCTVSTVLITVLQRVGVQVFNIMYLFCIQMFTIVTFCSKCQQNRSNMVRAPRPGRFLLGRKVLGARLKPGFN